MNGNGFPRVAALERMYHGYLVDQDLALFLQRVAGRYGMGTLERLVQSGPRLTRRAAALALGSLSDYSSNAVLGNALRDEDRGVRLLAESGLRNLWCRDGNEPQQQMLQTVIRLNGSDAYDEAAREASALIGVLPQFAEAWNQRAIAYYSLRRYIESIHDCRQAVELNPYHFGAVAGMGQCYLALGNQTWALESFRRALELNPSLEGIRGQVATLERRLKKQG